VSATQGRGVLRKGNPAASVNFNPPSSNPASKGTRGRLAHKATPMSAATRREMDTKTPHTAKKKGNERKEKEGARERRVLNRRAILFLHLALFLFLSFSLLRPFFSQTPDTEAVSFSFVRCEKKGTKLFVASLPLA
jgi:hypothetical protein